MKQVILIDKINLVTFIISIINFKKTVIVFNKTNSLKEKLFTCLFYLFFKKQIIFDLINYDLNPSFYKKIHKSTFDMTLNNSDELSEDELINYFCRSNLYNSLFKINEIEVFFRKKYDVKNIYINYINPLLELRNVNEFQNKIIFYHWFNSRGNDFPETAFAKMALPSILKSKLTWFFQLFRIKISINRDKKIDVKILYCSDRSYINNNLNNVFRKYNKNLDGFYNMNESCVYSKNGKIYIYSLHFLELPKYLLFVYKSIIKYRKIFRIYKIITLYDKIYFFRNVFFIERFIKNNNIKILFSVNETIINTILNSVASKSYYTIAVSGSWSLASFPLLCPGFNKMSDVNFCWGSHQVNTYVDSLDNSSTYVITGYLGDFAINEFRDKSINYNFDYIVFYDNVFYDDIFITKKQIYDTAYAILLFCLEKDIKLIIKTKYKKTYENNGILFDLAEKFKNTIIFEYGRADLTPAFNSKVAIGISNSSLVNIASCWGVESILYDSFNLINPKVLSNNCSVVGDKFQLSSVLRSKYDSQNMCFVDNGSGIDSFVDGNALNRIYEYIDSLQKFNGSKKQNIRQANLVYGSSYGQDKVINNSRRN
jgi:hypothetical protein